MNVEVEILPNCTTTLRVALPPEKVASVRETITRGFQRDAKIPGYRPGKAPERIILNRYKSEIEEELKRKLVSEGYREAVSAKNLRVLSLSEVDEVTLSEQDGIQFKATVITAPEFDLPQYIGIPVQVPSSEVAPEEVENALNDLRERTSTFEDIEGRGLQMDDFAVIDFTGTIDGLPVAEVSESAAKSLAQRENFWLKLAPDSFLKGLSDQLVGAGKGDQRRVELTLPEDFPVTDVAGKNLVLEVVVKDLKSRTLPEVTDEWAAEIVPGTSASDLRELLVGEIRQQKSTAADQARRKQIMDFLLEKVECELPPSYIRSEARRIMDDVVRENQMRGVGETELKDNEQQIIENSTTAAKNRVKVSFVLTRIAETEKIVVTREELTSRLRAMAARHNMTFEKLVKRLEENDSIGRVNEEILIGKVLDFLDSNATVSNAV